MNKEQHLKDLQEIREIMTRSSRFMSLSGLAGVLAGGSALLGAWLAYITIYAGSDYFVMERVIIPTYDIIKLLAIAGAVLLVSLGGGIFFSYRKAQKRSETFWNDQAKLVLINLMIPLAAGGILCLIMLGKGYVGVLAPITLVFYGLALVNASKYTLTEIRSLGLIEIVLGLVAMQFLGYGLAFWAVGFGVLHIVYGIWMYLKYER